MRRRLLKVISSRSLHIHPNPRAWQPRYAQDEAAAAAQEPLIANSIADRGRQPLGGRAPWLARTEAEESLSLTPHHVVHSAAKRVALDQASQVSVLPTTAIQENLKTLARLVPSFAYSQSQLSPAALVRLAEDMVGLFDRLAQLRAAFPHSNLSAMLGIRPELLLQEAFAGVPAAVAELRAAFPGADVLRIVERQPFLLLPNCPELLDEMLQDRLLPETLQSFRGKNGAAHQVERVLAAVQGSTIQATRAYQKQRKRIADSCARPLRPRPWEAAEQPAEPAA